MSSLDVSTLFGVKGMVVVITGGGTGIGLMMAKALEENGAKVYIIGRRRETLDKAAQQAKYGNIIPLQGDVTKKEDLLRIVDTITKLDGFINVLIANAGINGPRLLDKPKNPTLAEYREFCLKPDTNDFTHTFEVNVTAVYFSIITFLELLDAGNKRGNVEQKSQVIATSSAGGFSRDPIGGYAYSATKSGVIQMMKQFATAFVPFGIRSNVIVPGVYPSEMAAGFIGTEFKKQSSPKSFNPVERLGDIEDMAGVTLFLLSRAGGYLSGSVLLTDGGRLSIVPATY